MNRCLESLQTMTHCINTVLVTFNDKIKRKSTNSKIDTIGVTLDMDVSSGFKASKMTFSGVISCVFLYPRRKIYKLCQ